MVLMLDITMPRLNAWEFLDRLQKINLYILSQFRFYLITSSTDHCDKLKAQSYPVIEDLYHRPPGYRRDVVGLQ